MKNNNNTKKTEKKPKKAREPKQFRDKYDKSMTPDINNQSCTPDEGVSQLSNNQDAFKESPTIATPQSIPLYKYHKEYLGLKLKIMKTIGLLIHNYQEFSMLLYICLLIQNKFKNEIGYNIVNTDIYKNHENRVDHDMQKQLIIKKDELFAKFFEGEKIIQSLKQSKIIMDKENDASCIKINAKFFHILPSICGDLEKKFGERERQQNESEKVVCKGCGNKRNYYEIEAKIKCANCNSTEILRKNQLQINQKLKSIKIMKDNLKKVQGWKEEMDTMKKKEIERISQERSKNFQNYRVTDADKQVNKAKQFIQNQIKVVNGFVSPWKDYEIDNKALFIKLAEKNYKPKRQYERIRQLEQISQTRKKRKIDKNNI